jgi:hypothetical protein
MCCGQNFLCFAVIVLGGFHNSRLKSCRQIVKAMACVGLDARAGLSYFGITGA